MYRTVVTLLCVCKLIYRVCAIEIDNGIIDTPIANCQQDQIALTFRTQQPFRGNVYAKGYFNTRSCRVGATNQLQAQIVIGFDADCGLRRRRSTNPPGLVLESTIVIMFHNQFLTKVDRAYRIECFYMESNVGKTLTQQLEVSMIPTTLLSGGATAMPTCTYEVLQGNNPNGAPVQFAVIGDPVYHRWRCVGDGDFCMTVHSCNVDDGQGQSRALIDANGCAVDRYLLQNLNYPGALEAGQESHVFKFADRPSVYFNCQIRLNARESGQACVRTSDSCPSAPGFAGNLQGGSATSTDPNGSLPSTGGTNGGFRPTTGGNRPTIGSSVDDRFTTGDFTYTGNNGFTSGASTSGSNDIYGSRSGLRPNVAGSRGYAGGFRSNGRVPISAVRGGAPPRKVVTNNAGFRRFGAGTTGSFAGTPYQSSTRQREELPEFPTPLPFPSNRFGIFRRSAPFKLLDDVSSNKAEFLNDNVAASILSNKANGDASDKWTMNFDVASDQIDIFDIRDSKNKQKLAEKELEEAPSVAVLHARANSDGVRRRTTAYSDEDSRTQQRSSPVCVSPVCVSRTAAGFGMAAVTALLLFAVAGICQIAWLRLRKATHLSPEVLIKRTGF